MIYFISNENGAIKIGYTKNVKKRVRQLQVGNSGSLTLIGSIPGSPRDEKAIHAELADYRLSGEWFLDCRETQTSIAQHLLDSLPVADEPEEEPITSFIGPHGIYKIEIDPYRLARAEAALAVATAERIEAERQLAEVMNVLAAQNMAPAKRTESSRAQAPDAE